MEATEKEYFISGESSKCSKGYIIRCAHCGYEEFAKTKNAGPSFGECPRCSRNAAQFFGRKK